MRTGTIIYLLTAIILAASCDGSETGKPGRNLRIPEDVAVMGFDDLDMAEYFNLTTIRQHLDESGEIAVEMLLSRLNNPDRTVQTSKLSLEIIERSTT